MPETKVEAQVRSRNTLQDGPDGHDGPNGHAAMAANQTQRHACSDG